MRGRMESGRRTWMSTTGGLLLSAGLSPPDACAESATPPDDDDAGYFRALRRATAGPWPLQNQGLTRSLATEPGTAFLTVDLCPSTRRFDQDFFERLLRHRGEAPFPVGVSVSGLWLLKHQAAFSWLQERVRRQELAITWVNHTLRHRYVPTLPPERNFLLMAGTDARDEMLDNARLLLEHEARPSAFVRFPGLVSDRHVTGVARDLGLIPLGADAWLAKGQPIRDGSVVLVHANGNEPAGLRALTDDVLAATRWLPLADLLRSVEACFAVPTPSAWPMQSGPEGPLAHPDPEGSTRSTLRSNSPAASPRPLRGSDA